MKKFGKYEKRPEPKVVVVSAEKKTDTKQPKVKNMLLQTYFTSLLCLILCVTMFFGTSYAWFTSEVTNATNEIYVGTLKVGLYKGDTNLAGSSEKLFDSSVRWEPGYTALETIMVTNEGDLAFKYVLNFTEGKADNAKGEETTLADVAQYFDVWVYDYWANGQVKPEASSYKDIIAGGTENGTKWEHAGTLDKLLSGEAVLDGNMVTVRQDDKTDDPTTPNGTADGVKTVDTYTIALHMREDATSDVMGHKISLNVKLVAYQMASEEDSLGNKNYDQMATTEEQLAEMLRNGGSVALAADIELEDRITIPAGITVTLDLNGHSIKYVGDESDEGEELAIALTNNGQLTVNGTGTISGAYAGLYSTGTLTVNGGKFESANGFGLMVDNIYGTEASVATINGGTFTGVGVYNPTVVTVNAGTFNVGRDPDGAMDDVTLFVSPTFVGAPNTATVTLNGGTFKGNIYVYDDGGTETVFENKGATITGSVLDNA